MSSELHVGGGSSSNPHDDDEADELYPPRDKRARKLWHDLLKFKKATGKPSAPKSLELPPDSSYMRACAHSFAQRLGMRTEGMTLNGAKAVRVTLMPEAGAAADEATDAAAASRKRKTPGDADGDGTAPAAAAPAATGGAAAASAPAPPAKKPFVTRLAMAAKTTDADGAKAIFRDLIAAGLPCTPDMCAMF